MQVLICGAGVIGASIAYFLSRRGVKAIVIERTGLACAASGKSGGFLALDWCDGSPLGPLARRSFALHRQLTDEIDGDWGYRPLTAYSGSAGAGRVARRPRGAHRPAWLRDGVALDDRLGTTETTAQVHPGAFTTAMMRAAQANGAEFRLGQVTGILRRPGTARAAGLTLDNEVVEGDAIVVAMGPWSILAAEWLPLPGVLGLKGHSLIFKTGHKVPAEALFLEYRESGGEACSPEVFPRPDGTTYVCGLSSEAPLPNDPADVGPDPGAFDRLHALCRELSPVFGESEILARQACYRPVTLDGLPLIGPIAGVPGAFVATGHSVWGILNAPATGEAVAELITDGCSSHVDLSAFDPARMRPPAAGPRAAMPG